MRGVAFSVRVMVPVYVPATGYTLEKNKITKLQEYLASATPHYTEPFE